MKSLIPIAALTCVALGATSCHAAPPVADANNIALPAELKTGLILHLDAANAASLVRDANGRVTVWKDLSPAGHDAATAGASGPLVVADALNGRAVARFSGKEFLTVKRLAEGPGQLSAFAVFRRGADQASERRWQRIVSGWNGQTDNDNKAPSFLFDTNGSGKAMDAQILQTQLPNGTYRGAINIGRNAAQKNEFLEGDLAELLIYDRSFLTYDPIQNINQYLTKKWGVVVDTSTDWTLSGPLPTLPQRVSDELPLSDQKNAGQWRKFDTLWDEFSGAKLDATKWWDHNPNWYGRAPSRYVPQAVTVKGGEMGITMSIDESLPKEKLYPKGEIYERYATGSVVSKLPFRYGYCEIRFKPMNSAGSSAFWMSGTSTDTQGRVHKLEIDVFELGGGAPKFEKKFGMNAHVFQHPKSGDKHISQGGNWTAPFNFVDDYHVAGVEWTPDFIRYYMDGVLVRSLKNEYWHGPMNLIFDSETMGNWLGMPEDNDLPSTFTVDYVRAWKNAETDSDWTKEFVSPPNAPREPTDITKYVRGFDKR